MLARELTAMQARRARRRDCATEPFTPTLSAVPLSNETVVIRGESSMNEPEVLYKYMSAERALLVLPESGNGSLRVTQPATLNDPFECASRLVFDNPKGVVCVKAIAEKFKTFSRKSKGISGNIQSSSNVTDTHDWSKSLRDLLSLRFGIVSFSSNPLEPLLWAHYGDSGKGVAIGYDTSILKKIATANECFGPVQYQDKLPAVTDNLVVQSDRELQNLMLMKSRHWEYEKEWRLILDLSNTIGTGENDENGFPICLCSIPNEAVVEVIVTQRCPGEVSLRLHEILVGMHGYRGWPLEQLILAPDKYGYGYIDYDWTEGKHTQLISYTRPVHPTKRPRPPTIVERMSRRATDDA